MEATTHANLDRFITAYRQAGAYWLTYAIATGGEPDIKFDSAILKTSFHVRDAWEIGLHDEDCMGIQFEDAPVIPSTVATAPVAGLLKWMREREQNR